MIIFKCPISNGLYCFGLGLPFQATKAAQTQLWYQWSQYNVCANGKWTLDQFNSTFFGISKRTTFN